MGLFGKLLPVSVKGQSNVQILRRGVSEFSLKKNLAGRVVKEVFAAHDVRDALLGVVNNHGKLIGPQTVGSLDHEVTDVAFQVFGKRAAATIGETDNFVGGSDAKRPSRSAVRSVAADAGVDVRRKSELGLDCGDFLARACASVDESLLAEPA